MTEKGKDLAKENEIISKKNKTLNQDILELSQKLNEALLKITNLNKEELILKNEVKILLENKNAADKKINSQHQIIEDLKTDLKSIDIQKENLKQEINTLKSQNELS